MARARSMLTSLARLLSSIEQPIYLLDDQRRIVYCNAACERWLGISAEELAGQRCDYHSADQPTVAAERASALCPPPSVFQGQRQSATIIVGKASGETSQRHTRFEPLFDDAGALLGVLAIADEKEASECLNIPSPIPADTPEELHAQIQTLRAAFSRRFRVDRLAGTSLAAVHLREQVAYAIEGRGRTLIVGPPGSGREHVARTIHQGRVTSAHSPLLPLDCRLLDRQTLRGTIESFIQDRRQTNAESDVTLLFLEVDELSTDAQHELVGFFVTLRAKISILATAGTSLSGLVAQGRFRQDLASTLSTFVIELPPLASRSEDVAPLAQVILEETNLAGAKQLGGFTPDALRTLTAYPWPRHLDELSEVVYEACAKAAGVLVETADLPAHLRATGEASAHPRRADPPIVLDAFLADVEKELLVRALRQAKGNKAKAAKLLGMNRARLLRRMGQLGLE